WKRNYQEKSSKETWFILTNPDSLTAATAAYAKRMGIEGSAYAQIVVRRLGSFASAFRDFKRGGYNLEITRVSDRRLISLILLICLSYSLSTFIGQNIKSKGVAKYVSRPSEPKRRYSRSSSFSIGISDQNWLDSNAFFQDLVLQLLQLSPHKTPYYLKGMRAISLIQSAF
ncbi:MAG: IS4 family transposase, partial [Cyanobacteria bacterium P01_C01_bin.72]